MRTRSQPSPNGHLILSYSAGKERPKRVLDEPELPSRKRAKGATVAARKPTMAQKLASVATKKPPARRLPARKAAPYRLPRQSIFPPTEEEFQQLIASSRKTDSQPERVESPKPEPQRPEQQPEEKLQTPTTSVFSTIRSGFGTVSRSISRILTGTPTTNTNQDPSQQPQPASTHTSPVASTASPEREPQPIEEQKRFVYQAGVRAHQQRLASQLNRSAITPRVNLFDTITPAKLHPLTEAEAEAARQKHIDSVNARIRAAQATQEAQTPRSVLKKRKDDDRAAMNETIRSNKRVKFGDSPMDTPSKLKMLPRATDPYLGAQFAVSPNVFITNDTPEPSSAPLTPQVPDSPGDTTLSSNSTLTRENTAANQGGYYEPRSGFVPTPGNPRPGTFCLDYEAFDDSVTSDVSTASTPSETPTPVEEQEFDFGEWPEPQTYVEAGISSQEIVDLVNERWTEEDDASAQQWFDREFEKFCNAGDVEIDYS